jgi:hypothetical protein
MSDTSTRYTRADALCRAMMAMRPDLAQNMSFDEWIAVNELKLTRAERVAADAVLALHPDYSDD